MLEYCHDNWRFTTMKILIARGNYRVYKTINQHIVVNFAPDISEYIRNLSCLVQIIIITTL